MALALSRTFVVDAVNGDDPAADAHPEPWNAGVAYQSLTAAYKRYLAAPTTIYCFKFAPGLYQLVLDPLHPTFPKYNKSVCFLGSGSNQTAVEIIGWPSRVRYAVHLRCAQLTMLRVDLTMLPAADGVPDADGTDGQPGGEVKVFGDGSGSVRVHTIAVPGQRGGNGGTPVNESGTNGGAGGQGGLVELCSCSVGAITSATAGDPGLGQGTGIPGVLGLGGTVRAQMCYMRNYTCNFYNALNRTGTCTVALCNRYNWSDNGVGGPELIIGGGDNTTGMWTDF